MSGHRRSALLLHSLAETDRRWILTRLAAEDQSILVDHLTELKSLGIPIDSSLTDAAANDAPARVAVRSRQRGVTADPVQAASAAQMQLLLADEPVWLVRHVLALENWSWRQDFLAALAPAQRERLRTPRESPAASDGKLAERLRAQLVSRLAEFDLDRAANQPIEASRGVLASLQQVARRWM